MTTEIHRTTSTASLLLILAAAAAGCGPRASTIPGTDGIPRTDENQQIIERVEEYRVAVEQRDAATLLMMASPDYWEDSGTPTGEDDYGYDGLKDVLAGRFQKADSIRYAVRYMRIRRAGERAFVDVLIDASYTIPDHRGEMARRDKRDQNQLVMEWNGEKWLFVAGM